jgi:hypothetical protein
MLDACLTGVDKRLTKLVDVTLRASSCLMTRTKPYEVGTSTSTGSTSEMTNSSRVAQENLYCLPVMSV